MPRDEVIALLSPRLDPGVELRVALRHDTVPAGGSEPVELLYFIVNGRGPTPFLNLPDRFIIRVETQDGRPAPGGYVESATVADGPQVQLVLPSYAILGQVENLRCMSLDDYTRADRRDQCSNAYPLREPGTYRVILRYDANDDGPFAGRDLADTATLVVR
jgi:hypothetical protein